MSLLFSAQTLPVKRPKSKGRWVQGRYVDAEFISDFSVTATVHPDSGYKLTAVLEGKRVSAIIKLFCDTELRAADPKTGTTGDVVSYGNFDWEVIQSQPWGNGIMPHFECYAIREKEGN